jgi:hypothetical protein
MEGEGKEGEEGRRGGGKDLAWLNGEGWAREQWKSRKERRKKRKRRRRRRRKRMRN